MPPGPGNHCSTHFVTAEAGLPLRKVDRKGRSQRHRPLIDGGELGIGVGRQGKRFGGGDVEIQLSNPRKLGLGHPDPGRNAERLDDAWSAPPWPSDAARTCAKASPSRSNPAATPPLTS
jgi:hypothetical protein